MQKNEQVLDHVTGRKEITSGNLSQFTVYFAFFGLFKDLVLIFFFYPHTHCFSLQMNEKLTLSFPAAVFYEYIQRLGAVGKLNTNQLPSPKHV